MTTYIPLGARYATGAVTSMGTNSGNWTVTFPPDVINCNTPYFEIYHIVIQGAPSSTFTVYIDNYQWDTSQQGYLNSWDPSQPMPLQPGQTLYFYWSDPDTDNTPPSVTIWLRYDIDIPANNQNSLQGVGG